MQIDLAIVEDDPGDVELIRKLLHDVSPDFNVRHTPHLSDLDALCAANRTPDVLLLDLNGSAADTLTTNGDGKRVLTRIPTVGITSSRTTTHTDDSNMLGVKEFLIKGDFDGDRLATTLHAAITRHRGANAPFDHANYDRLTGLANQHLFRDRVDHALQRIRRTSELIAVLFIDLDNFAAINKRFGCDIGDGCLCKLADTLRENVRSGDTVARIGGDEFAILAEGLQYPQAAVNMASTLLATAACPIVVGDQLVDTSFRIGVAFYTKDMVNDGEWLLHSAGNALRTAKLSDSPYCTATEELDRNLIDCINQDAMLQRAVKKNEFELYYQPILDTVTKELLAYETLLRWRPPHGGDRPVLPGNFIASLERLGLMRDVGAFVLRSAIAQHAQWLSRGMGQTKACVNVSASQLAAPDFAILVRSLLDEYAMPPELLCLELTEDLLINDSSHTQRIFSELSDYGVNFSIDDFGTGHNSYSYLKKFPISAIKIDRSFTRLLHVDQIDRAITRSLITLARELNVKIIAEGVENHIVLAELEALKPDALQGFLIGRPAPVQRFEERFLNLTETSLASAMSV